MVRSAHKKSRRGCATCKKRHVKCDENRPSCINCVTVNRHCAYLDNDALVRNSSADSHTASNANSPALALPPDIPSDLLYVHALNQWICHTQEIFCPTNVQHHHPGTIMLNHALEHSFLLHGLLALSTFHLGASQPENREQYFKHSQKLLTQGLEGFNGVLTRLCEGNIIPAFVFSVVAGFCKFAHVFSVMHRSVNDFLDQLIESITMLRGINIVITGWWPLITSSSLFKALYPESEQPYVGAFENDTESEDLPGLKRLLQESDLDLASTQACKETVAQLQALYAISTKKQDDPKSEAPDFVFFIRMPSAFHSLLLQRKPEALIIVAHLAPLMHRRRTQWLVGNAGEVLVNAITDYLGPGWTGWLQTPIEAIKSDP